MQQSGKNDYIMFFWVILAAVLGGGIPVFSKMALSEFPTFTFIFVRFLTASFILVPLIIRAFSKAKEKIRLNQLLPLVVVSIFGTGNVVFFAFGVKQTAAIVAQVLYAAVPIIALIASAVILKTTFNKRKITGVLVGLVGVFIIVLSSESGNAGDSTITITGNLLVFAAVTSYSLFTVLSKKAQEKYSPLVLTTMMVITTLVIQTALITTEIPQYNSTLPEITMKGIVGVLYAGIFGTALYVLLYQHVIKKANPVVASMTFYLQPMFSYIWAFFLLHEQLTINLIIGGCFAFIGAGIVTRKSKRKFNEKT